MLAGRNEFIENDAFNFVFYLIDQEGSQRLDYVLMNIYSITQLPFDIIQNVIDLYNQRHQSRIEYLTGKMFSCAMRSNKEWASFYEAEISKIKKPAPSGF